MYDFKIEAADAAICTATWPRRSRSRLSRTRRRGQHGECRSADLRSLPDINWVGFTATSEGTRRRPIPGRPACIRIKFGEGVCGAAAAARQVQRVQDVHAFPGHIACDAASASELVVPIIREGELVAVLDIDSPRKGRFTEEDEAAAFGSPKSWLKRSSSAAPAGRR